MQEKKQRTFYFDVDDFDNESINNKDLEQSHVYRHASGKRRSQGISSSFSDDSSLAETASLTSSEFDVNDEIYDIVDAVVPRTDDPNTPALTFRSLNPFIVVLISYPLGNFLSYILPRDTFNVPIFNLPFHLNPGPFSFKEHTLIYVFTVTAARPAYSLYNMVVQKYILGQNISVAWCIAFVIGSQCFGYGLAGLSRRFLVRPAAMLWPSNLGTLALLRSLSDRKGISGIDGDEEVEKTYKFFPSYIAPALGAVSLLCHIAPNNQRVKMLGSAKQGLGMLSLSFDWSMITVFAPIVTPFWAFVNQFVGIWLTMWLIIPLVWHYNLFGNDQQIGSNPFDGPNGTGQFPLGQALNSPSLFTNDGQALSAISILTLTNHTVELNEAAYDAVKPVRLTTYFAVEYASYFVMFSAVMCHVALWYGKQMWARMWTSLRDLDVGDIHARMMDVYPEVSDVWYYILLVATLCLTMLSGHFGGFDLPYWSVLLSLFVSGVCMIPIGTIEAISGQQIGLNVVSELIIGFIDPGKMVTVMSFKTLTYVGTIGGLSLVEDLKLGHYAKVPPRAMFLVQLVGTVLAACVNVLVAVGVYEVIGVDRMNESPPLGWTPVGYQIFLSAGTIWGGIGPQRFFGPNSPYHSCIYGFIIGLVLPLFFYVLHRLHPKGPWHLVNVPLLAVFPMQAGTTRSDLITPFIIAVLVNVVVRKYWKEGWSKYAYVVSAGLDTGAAVAVTVVLCLVGANPGYQILMPFWALNRFDQESCAPDYYNTCIEHAIWGQAYGRTYNVSEDIGLCQTFGGDAFMGPPPHGGEGDPSSGLNGTFTGWREL
ncbi:hypothetical protein HDU97_005586 [Phlyctochytrium planicorne]|nr:hypothetical protein HDU97_005586 [Phlyctochytrium planicorne]